MKLKAVITKDAHASLPEAHKEFYVASGDKFVLDTEGVEELPGVLGLKTALNSERDNSAKALKEYNKLKASIGDMDPEAARAALVRVQEMADKKLIDDGQVEELFKQRLERVNADHANQIKAKDTALTDAQQKLAAKTNRIKTLTLEGEITRLATDPKIGIKPSMLPYVIGAFTSTGIDGVRWDLDENDKVTALSGDVVKYGKDGAGAMSIEEGFELLRAKAADFFLPSSGAGASNTVNGRTATGAHSISRANAADPALYRSAKAEAAKAGVELAIV